MPFARASLIIFDHGSAKYLPVILLLTMGFLLIFQTSRSHPTDIPAPG
jgi:hypothetical protein